MLEEQILFLKSITKTKQNIITDIYKHPLNEKEIHIWTLRTQECFDVLIGLSLCIYAMVSQFAFFFLKAHAQDAARTQNRVDDAENDSRFNFPANRRGSEST